MLGRAWFAASEVKRARTRTVFIDLNPFAQSFANSFRQILCPLGRLHYTDTWRFIIFRKSNNKSLIIIIIIIIQMSVQTTKSLFQVPR